MENIVPKLWTIIFAWFGLKTLLFNCYVSTDFEVHRNWLAITYNLPINRWYVENTSIWTLDYPPFFAWFEYGLSQMAGIFLLNGTVPPNGSLLEIRPESINMTSDATTLIYQRFTVLASDIIFIAGALECVRFIFSNQRPGLMMAVPESRKTIGAYVISLLLCCNVGLLFVDNIHFQYNGFLFGFLLFSMAYVGDQRYLLAALVFAILLNLKHIFLYLAPAYAAYFLRNYCFTAPTPNATEAKKARGNSSKDADRKLNGFMTFLRTFSPWNFIKLLTVGIVVFAISFGPFIYHGQLGQVLSRLFPFKRGLTHAYWAPNFWALYNAADYVAAIVSKRYFKWINYDSIPGYATGLVQEFDHVILPTVKPISTFIITVLTMLPACSIVAIKRTKWDSFVVVLTLCAFSSFLFGWHVHEKAVLMILIPMTLLVIYDRRYARIFLLLSVVGHFSLFPLLFQRFESPIKYTAYLVYIIGAFWALQTVFQLPMKYAWGVIPRLPLLNIIESLYVVGFLPLELASTIMEYHPLFKKFTFAPLMLTSIYCAIGAVYCWISIYWTFLCKELNLNTHLLMKRWRRERLLLRKELVMTNCESWQNALRDGVATDRLRFIGGLDVSTPDGDNANAIGCLAVLSYPDLKVVHSIYEHVTIDAPYVAGYLAFREAPVMISLVERLREERPDLMPQVLFVDGNGVLHPDRFGLACHVGVICDVPTIGVAKDLHLMENILRPSSKRLEEELIGAGTSIMLASNEDGQTLGAAVRASLASKNAIFVSVGHRIDLKTAVKLTVQCSSRRVPEPIRAADSISREHVRRMFT